MAPSFTLQALVWLLTTTPDAPLYEFKRNLNPLRFYALKFLVNYDSNGGVLCVEAHCFQMYCFVDKIKIWQKCQDE